MAAFSSDTGSHPLTSTATTILQIMGMGIMATTGTGTTAIMGIAGTVTVTDRAIYYNKPMESSGFAKAEPLSFGSGSRPPDAERRRKYILDLFAELETITGCLIAFEGELCRQRARAAEA
jgi:hypothetical protein